MNFDQFLQAIPKINNLPLPGQEAHFTMAPMERVKQLKEVDIAQFNPKQAGVMALFYPNAQDETCFVLMLRKTYEGVHSNQVSFPGGKKEDGDRDILHTALRETEEEIGVTSKAITIIRPMTNVYIPPSNFQVQCYMGYVAITPTFIPEESEVAQLIEASVSALLNPDTLTESTLTTSYAHEITVPAFALEGHIVWGATAMLLNEIKTLFNEALNL